MRNARIGCKKGCFSAERTDEASACNLHWEEVKELKPSEFAQVLFATYSKPAPKHAGLVKTASVTRHNTRDPGHFDLPAAPRAAQNLRVPSLGTFTSPVRHPWGLRCWTPGTLQLVVTLPSATSASLRCVFSLIQRFEGCSRRSRLPWEHAVAPMPAAGLGFHPAAALLEVSCGIWWLRLPPHPFGFTSTFPCVCKQVDASTPWFWH